MVSEDARDSLYIHNLDPAQHGDHLDAKLHQSYDPTAEFQAGGLLQSNVAYPAFHQNNASPTLNRLEDAAIINTPDTPKPQTNASDAGNNAPPVSSIADASHTRDTYQDNDATDIQQNNIRKGVSENTPTVTPNELLGDNNSDDTGLQYAEPFHPQGGNSGSHHNDDNSKHEPIESPPPPPPIPLVAPDVQVSHGTGRENMSLPITIMIHADPSATNTYITIGNMPTGAALSAGVNNGDGTWTLTPAQLTGLTLTTPHGYSGDFNLNVSAISFRDNDQASTSITSHIEINGIPNTPFVSIEAAYGNENTAIALNITAALTDTDGSETLSIKIIDVPPGARLSAGTDNGDGTWTLAPEHLSGLTITPPENYSGHFVLTVAAIATENNITSSILIGMLVTVAEVEDTTTVTACSPENGGSVASTQQFMQDGEEGHINCGAGGWMDNDPGQSPNPHTTDVIQNSDIHVNTNGNDYDHAFGQQQAG